MKKILIVPVILLLTGCVSVSVEDTENTCYRYIDYKGDEHIVPYKENYCTTTRGGLFYCHDGDKYITAVEYEKIECEENE